MPDQERQGLLDSFDGESVAPVKHNALEPEPHGFKEMLKKWPKATFCIVGNEFCERFSYYGMRAVLTLYLLNILQFNNDNATILYHAFTVVAYASSLLGSILADGYIGKFWTIFFVSIVYAGGNVMLAVSSTFDKASHIHPYLDFAALFVIGLGTGGIKPCVSSFGADQFPSHHTKMISIFFSVFYFTVNAGSTISMALTPIFRTMPCMGHDSCYPLAFGVPAGLMLLATVLFMVGSVSYKKVPPKENTIKRVCVTISVAIFNFFRNWNTKRDHWMDHFLDNHRCENDPKCLALAVKGKRVGEKCAQQQFADDCKSLVRVTVMMLPVPMFWALYDQQGSRWLLQAVEMETEIWSGFNILPDQMSIVNAILILIFIPIFQSAVYPAVERCGIRTTPLRKMVVGGLLAALSFAVCGFVQLRVNQTLPDIPAHDTSFVSIINAFPNCGVTVTNDMMPHGNAVFIPANTSLIEDKVKAIDELYRFKVGSKKNVTFIFTYNGTDCFDYDKNPLNIVKELNGGTTYYIATTPQGLLSDTSSLKKPQEGEGESSVSLDFLIPCSSLPANVTWDKACNATNNSTETSYNSTIAACEISDRPHCDPRNKLYGEWNRGKHVPLNSLRSDVSQGTRYGHQDLKPGTYQLFYVKNNQPPGTDRTPSEHDLQFVQIPDVVLQIKGQGGVYTLTVAKDGNLRDLSVKKNLFNVHPVVPKNHVNIVWQLPQYVIITAAEILFSIPGLEFSYSQAAPSLKSVVTALWLITVAFGDAIIIIIDMIVKIENLAIIMFVFGAAMVIVIGVFTLMSIFYYDYVDYSKVEQEDESLPGGEENGGYEEVDESVKL